LTFRAPVDGHVGVSKFYGDASFEFFTVS